ncbi:ABC transporter permease [Ramlibacter albus]|uniref:FtsX-like permease family protein n=1 Tax=Ramlibacter albus TaxID=2079448 RepID=A0A923S3J3_9BURK|nr:FtsX-like permease family protein [Ramlibacter albus]MBC5765893.1 FtsX-like permease family protein [Ramlibacter albus]
MKTLALAFRYLWSRPIAAVLNLLLLTLGLASITFVLLVGSQVSRSFERDLAGIDAVIGAKGSPMQLILSGVFHIDVPTGNVKLEEVERVAKMPQIAQVIPLSLGDSYRGFRIVGTTPAYMEHYRVRVAAGTAWREPMEAVAGAEVAHTLGVKPGDSFAGSHGLAGAGDKHADKPYRITGVLAACGCVVDRLVLTSTESVWHIHEMPGAKKPTPQPATHKDHGKDKDAHDSDHDDDREVTVALVKYRTPLAAATFPRFINSQTGMQAAAPAVEVTRLLRMLGVGREVLQGVGAVLLLSAALSVFVALWNAVRERRADLAMLRMLGATPAKVAALLVCEALWLAVLASVIGLGLGHLLTEAVGTILQAQQSLPVSGAVWVRDEAWIPALALAVAALAAAIPAVSAYRVDVAHLLNSR